MQTVAVLEHQVSFRVFDTQLGVQGMEDICELQHCLVSFLSQRSPFCILFILASNRVILFLNNILERNPSGYCYRTVCS
jgi:hypothetical protein